MSHISRLPTPPTNAGPSAQGSSVLASLIGEITGAKSFTTLNTHLKEFGTKETREQALAGMLPGGMDPLSVLDVAQNTLGYLYILSARVTVSASSVSPDSISDFCQNFSPEQARIAPERVTMLAKGIAKLAESSDSSKAAIQPLYNLLSRYPPTLAYLTTIHPIFLRLCVSTRHFTAAVPVLSVPITEVSTTLCDLHYNDHFIYHYAGGMAWAALKKWKQAEAFFEAVVSAPAQVPAAIQMEAYKKLTLVQLIGFGKTKPVLKYTNGMLIRLFKASPYAAFAKHYPSRKTELLALAEKEQELFRNDRNTGLIKQALEQAPKWSIKKLTETYLTLSMSDIGRKVGIASTEQVGSTILSMIERDEIQATISADGTVTFGDSDPLAIYTRSQIEAMLRAAQDQGALLAELDKQLGRSKEFLNKALKNKDDGTWGEDDLSRSMAEREAGFAEESIF